jgi:general secretion pathway protein D
MNTNRLFRLDTVARLVSLAALFLLLVSANVARAQQNITATTTTTVYPVVDSMELGPVLDVIPFVLSDGYTVNLTLIPTLTEFVGYETPPTLPPLPAGAILVPAVLPAFRARQVVTTVNVWDGQTVVLGGLILENVQKINDKVPVLGDIPLMGRLFRSESKSTQKKNLMIFVTPTIIDQAGNRLHTEEEMPFYTQTSVPPQPRATPNRPATSSQPAVPKP